MKTEEDIDPAKEQDASRNDNTELGDDTLGENTGDSALEKDREENDPSKKDDPRIKTVTPDNDNGRPGPPSSEF